MAKEKRTASRRETSAPTVSRTKKPPAASPKAPRAPTTDKRLVRLRSGEERRRVNMLFPVDLALRLRRYCADKDTNLTDTTIAAIDEYLRGAGY